jgi:hypothetical protein
MKSAARLIVIAIKRGLLIFLCFSSSEVMASEIKAFTMLDVQSELAFRYLYDEQAFFLSGVKTQQDIRPTFQEEYSVATQSYVFHPNLLSMELGGSFLLDQSSIETLDEKNSNNEKLLGYNARLDFLNKKPYPLSIYYDKQNPSVSVGLAGRFIQENIKYGAEFSLMQPVSPVQVTLSAYRQYVRGSGLDQITDDDLEHAEIRLYRPYNKGDYVQLSYQIDNRDSRSGNPDLPIQTRTTSTTSTYFDSKNVLGGLRQGELITIASYNTQQEFPRRKELRVNPIINWQHSNAIRSFYRVNYNKTTEEDINIEQSYLTGGIAYSGKNNTASIDVHGEDNKSTGLDYKNVGASYNINHQRPVALGEVKLSYSGSVDYRDQTATDQSFEIFGEVHVMTGTTPITLKREFVDKSVPIAVWNDARTQLYISGLDYRILDVGSQTQLQRLSSGSIISGQTLLIDYSYLTGGDFAFDLISNNLQLSWNPSSFYEMYIRYLNSQQNLRDGLPTVPLNSLSSVTYGMRADRPLENGVNLGGEIYLEERDEDINPFTRQNIDAYVEFPLPHLTNLRLSSRYLIVDNENSVEDVNLTGYILRLQARPWLRARLSFESSYENDTGGTIDRTLKIQRVQLGWAFRQLSLTADAHYSDEHQGVTDRQRWAIKFILSRLF